MHDEIKFRLAGEGMKPGLIRSKEIAEILEAVENMAIAEALRADSTLSREDVVVGLYSIDEESIGLKFKTTFVSSVIPAFILAAEAIATEDYASLTPQTLDSLKVISKFSKKHTCNAIISSGSEITLAVITPETEIPTPSYISGQTEILGKVIRVGGKKPKAMLELIDGSILYCDVSKEIAEQLGRQLYGMAKFNGNAKWNAKTLVIEAFNITGIGKFPEQSPNQVLDDLAKFLGEDAFAHIEDVEKFVASLRNGEDEVSY